MREGASLRASDMRFLPIVSAYARTLGLVEEVDRLCGHERGISPGRIVLALIVDALSGRTPLFRLPQAFAKLDTELVLGEAISPEKLNDDAVGRVLDRIFEVGTSRVLSAVALRAVKLFDLDTTHVHHDTTSRGVYGDYDLYGEESHDQPFVVTFGFSKAHRPDLKQLVHSLLCVDAGIPIYSKCENGNESDKVVNRNLIPTMVERMAELGQDNFLYVADSALITPDNLALMDDWKSGFRFVSRLPASYKECSKAIAKAVRQDSWHDLGTLSLEPSTPKRKPAHYHGFETVVDLYGVWYRALVVHSDAYDERRVKRLERTLEQDKAEVERIASEQEKIEYACLPDAQAAVSRLPKGRFHELVGRIEEKPIYATGRPKADGTRKINRTTYRLNISLQPREQAISRARKEVGCFVLITNEPEEASGGLSSKELLRAYQDQHSVEQNFGFLKDPVIVNALFLKSPRRIEALGLILVLALMVWRLMERTMRISLKESNSKVHGWNNRQTSRPTSFMMTTKFVSVIVIRIDERRFLAEPLDPIQERYLRILGLSAAVFTNPSVKVIPDGGAQMQRPRGTG
ncbi:MAG: IS1634 family transposase [Deltaproteobacteria bacterium]|nr:IS1634 family transposase [Deltaproteobacteria bacterium]